MTDDYGSDTCALLPWERKAHHVIRQMSHEAWRRANHDRHGCRYKRHRPYTIPAEAELLVEILGWRDRAAAEREAKAVFQMLAFRDMKT